MSGLDVASGIAGLIALSLQVSGTIAQYAVAVKDHSKNVKELHDELLLLGQVLSRLNDFVQTEKAKGRTFEQDSVLVNAINDCKRRIERIGDKLKVSSGGKLSRTIDKLKWPFEQKDILQLIENLRRYVHTFEFALTIKNSEFLSQSWDEANKSLKLLQTKVDQACETNKLLGEPIDKLLERSQQLQQVIEILPTLLQQSEDLKEVSQAVKLAEQREQERRKTDILEWLTPLSSLQKHVELQNRRAPGTCTWLLGSDDFETWTSLGGVQYDMLCQGGPGVGKTVLCSMVIDHLRTKHKSADVAIAYYYFDLAEQQSQTEYSLVRSILRQLCQHFNSIPSAVADFYQRTRNELADALWLQELQSVLHRVVATFSQCYIVIDAFDEMDGKKRAALVAILESIRASSERVKFFATSRPHVVIEQFRNALKLEVRASEDDLRDFLGRKIDGHQHSSDIIDEDLKQRMLDRLCSHADGVFLLPALQIDQILDQAVSPGDIERAIVNLSTNLREVFQSTIMRIESFSGGKRNLAFKTLMWLSHARRPLRIEELQHAIAVRFDGADVDSRDISTITVILDSCCGLVELDGESACVKFVHGSIAEYLQVEDHGFFKDAELEIVRVCLKYLTMESLKTLPFKPRNDFLKAMETYPLLDYASSFWGFHARGLNVQRYQDLALLFCNSSLHLLVAARVRDVKVPEFRKWGERMLAWSISGGAGISVAVSFGLADLTRFLISQTQTPVLNARNTYGSTPLHVCAIFGFEDTAEVLIAHGADLLDSNRGRATPFYLAVSYGQLDMCRSLLKYDRFQLDVACKDRNTALHKATDIGNDVMVEFLLQSGASIHAQTNLGMTPLHLAARRGFVSIVRMLILAGANAEATDRALVTPLDLAAIGGHRDVVQYLLQQDISVNNKSADGWTPLHRAARSGQIETVKLLLAAGASLLALDRQKMLPVQIAIKSGSLDTVRAILQHDRELVVQQLNHENSKKDRAINIAFYTSHYDIYEYLRDVEGEMIKDDPNSVVDSLLSLSRAIELGDLPQVQRILQIHPDWLVAKDNFDQTPLHTAFRTEQWSIADYLLCLGASINSRGYHGWTPLHMAAASGNMRMLQLALQWNADLYLVSDSLQTPLHKAASSRSVEVLIELMRCGCLPSALNDKAMTPVHVAASRNFLDGVMAMIQPEFGGRDVLLSRDRYGRRPRDWADRAGHLELSAVLKDEERRAKGRPSKLDHIANHNNSMSQLSRQSTRESLSRQSTGLSPNLLSQRLEQSISSLEDISGHNSGLPSPLFTPGTPARQMTNLSHTPSMDEVERRYAEMQLEFESD